jgi:hypothetical protein
MSYHESIVQSNVREVTTQARDQPRDQPLSLTDSVSLSDSTSSLPRLVTPPITRRASEVHVRAVPADIRASAEVPSSPAAKRDPGRTKFSNRFSRQNARASSYFKPNSFTNGAANTSSRSPRAQIPSSFMASPPPSLGSTPLPSYDDLFEYFKSNKLAPLVPAPRAPVAASSLAPTWRQIANLGLFVLRLGLGYFGCGPLAVPAPAHFTVLLMLSAATLMLAVHKYGPHCADTC